MDVCHFWVLGVLSVRGLYDGQITRPEESYRMWCVWVWSWNLNDEEVQAHQGCQEMKKKYLPEISTNSFFSDIHLRGEYIFNTGSPKVKFHVQYVG
jgi:hypothetical protein